jgi:hypothetical protein
MQWSAGAQCFAVGRCKYNTPLQDMASHASFFSLFHWMLLGAVPVPVPCDRSIGVAPPIRPIYLERPCAEGWRAVSEPPGGPTLNP